MADAPMIETARVPLTPEEHQKLGALIRQAEEAKKSAAAYVDELGRKYSMHAKSVDCSIGFENGFAIILEPKRVLIARPS